MMFSILPYGLPVLLGYTLFAGISGRLNPFSYPAHREERPSWLLGIWTGIGLSVALNVGMFQAYMPPVVDTFAAFKTSTALLAILVAPALGLYAYFRYRNSGLGSIRKRTNFNWAITEEELLTSTHHKVDAQEQASIDTKGESAINPTDTALEEHELKISPAYLETARIDEMDSGSHGEAVNDLLAISEQGTGTESAQEQTSKILSHSAPPEQHSTATDESSTARDLIEKLAAEVALREETESHLRITRKALSVLEANTRQQSNSEADTIIALEEKLAQSIERAADSETEAMEQRARREEIEQDVADLKRRMVKAKQEIRQSAAARAKALSTANQSIAFARQSVQIRTRLESDLSEARTTIKNRQKTISSLIRALEKEKRKTQSEVGSMARQMFLQEKQLKARRSLEEVARSVENSLTSRLVKKVAKAKPLTSGMNQGEAN